MTRIERQQQIKQMFPDEVLDIKKPDILRGNAAPQPEKKQQFGVMEIVLFMVFLLGLLVLCDYMGWIKVVGRV